MIYEDFERTLKRRKNPSMKRNFATCPKGREKAHVQEEVRKALESIEDEREGYAQWLSDFYETGEC